MQLNDSLAYFDLHQEMFWLGGQAVYRPAGMILLGLGFIGLAGFGKSRF